MKGLAADFLTRLAMTYSSTQKRRILLMATLQNANQTKNLHNSNHTYNLQMVSDFVS